MNTPGAATGARIRTLRENKGLTQAHLAELVGVREKTVSRWENGRHTIQPSNARRVAEALDVDASAILGDTPAPPGPNDVPQLDRIEGKLDALLEHVGVSDPGEELEAFLDEPDPPSDDINGGTVEGGPGRAATGP